MKFGKEFKNHLEETIPEWRDKFLCYKPLKKLLKQQVPAAAAGGGEIAIHDAPAVPSVDADRDLPEPAPRTYLGLQAWFIGILSDELDKFNDFYVDKEEEFVIRFQVLFPCPFVLIISEYVITRCLFYIFVNYN